MKMEMDKIETVYGKVKLTSMSLKMLSINRFFIPLDETEKYIDEVPIPDKNVIKIIIEGILKGKDFIEGEQAEVDINCKEENYGQEIVASWKICFEIIKYYRPKLRKLRKLVKLCYAHSKKNIPFKIEGADVLIKIGKKWVVVPIHTYSMIKSENASVVFPFLGCSLEGKYR